MATTEHFRNGGGTTLPFTFPILANSDLKVEIYNATSGLWELKTENTSGQTNNDYTISNTNVVFNSATPSGTGNVHIYRTTNVDNPAAVYAAGSSIRAVDLNDNQTQILYSSQEAVGQLVRETDLKDSIVTSAKIANGTIVNDDINANAEIAVSKLADGSARQLLQTDAAGTGVEWSSNIDIPGTLDVTGNVDLDANLNVDGNTTLVGTLDVDGNTTLDGTTIDGVLDVNGSATIDNISIDGSEVSSTSGNLVLDGAGGWTVINSNLSVKPDGTNSQFIVHQTDGIVAKAHLTPNTDDTYDLGSSDKQFKDLYIDGTGNIDHVVADTITGGAVVTSGASTDDNKVYSAKRAGEIFYEKGTLDDITSGISWVSDDNKLATTAAIDARIVDLVDDVGGFVPITNETSFPNANPDVNNGTGTLVSVPLANNISSNGSGVITITNGTVGNSTVTITDAGANKTFDAGFGIIVETTSTLNTYTFHRYVPNATAVTTVAGSIGNVNTVATDIGNVNSVAGNISNVNAVNTNATNINSAVSNANNINSAVSNSSNINTVAGISGNVTTVAGISSDVTAVANDATDIGAVAGKATEIGRLGTADAVADLAILGTADAVADMNTLGTSSNVTNMNTLAGISGNVTTVAGISSNVTTVANDGTDIGTVAGSIGNVNTAAGSIGNVNTVAGSISSVNTVAGNNTNVNTVAGISGNVTTVAGIASNVTTIAGNNSNVNTVAGSIANVNTTAGSISNVNTTAGSIANVNTVATNITGVNNASTYLNNFLSLYLGTAASAPTQDALGNAVTEGDLYFNTGNKQLQIFNGSVFTNIVDTAIDFAKLATAAFNALYTASAGSNSIDLGGLAITGAAFANEAVATNRISLAKGSATYNLGGI